MPSGEGMETFIQSINTGLGPTAVWGAVAEIAPYMITTFLIAVGYYVFRKVAKGGSKLKFRV